MSGLKSMIPIGVAVTALVFGPAVARAHGGPDSLSVYAVVVHHIDLQPQSRGAAHAVLDRLGDAALEACGASSFSPREMKMSIKSSQCWKDSMADIVARTSDPAIQAAYEREQLRALDLR